MLREKNMEKQKRNMNKPGYLWPPSAQNWTIWVALGVIIAAVTLIYGGSVDPPPPPGTQPITDCESVVTNAPQDRLEVPTGAIEISVYFSAEECQYLPRIALEFNRAYINGTNPLTGEPLAAGERPIFVTGKPVSSGTVREGILRELTGFGTGDFVPPTIWSPSSIHFLSLLNEDVKKETFDLSAAQATALAPVVMAIWESRLEAIRNTVGYDDIGWDELLDVLHSPNGWCDYGIPGCRRSVYYGHTNPNFSPTGLSTLITEFYASARQHGFTGRTLTLDVVNNQEVQEGVREIEQLIRHYSRRTTEFKHYIAQGPDYVDFVALEENDVITINRGLTEFTPPERLVALYPKEGTLWHEHPFGIPVAPWVTPEQREAARVFTEYVLMPTAQELIVSEGFRPANSSVALGFPFDPQNGVTAEGPTQIMAVPSGEVILAVQNTWSFVKKPADIMLLIDTSGSMGGDKLRLAQAASLEFVNQVEDIGPGNRMSLFVFNHDLTHRIPLGTVENNGERLRDSINGLGAEGGTCMYQALTAVVNQMNANTASDRIRIVILLSDGKDECEGGVTLNATIQAIEASSQSQNPVIVIPIAYGGDADITTLTRIAAAGKVELQNATNPDNIQSILNLIASWT
jgi:Ca-activated chloride channel family protein